MAKIPVTIDTSKLSEETLDYLVSLGSSSEILDFLNIALNTYIKTDKENKSLISKLEEIKELQVSTLNKLNSVNSLKIEDVELKEQEPEQEIVRPIIENIIIKAESSGKSKKMSNMDKFKRMKGSGT